LDHKGAIVEEPSIDFECIRKHFELVPRDDEREIRSKNGCHLPSCNVTLELYFLEHSARVAGLLLCRLASVSQAMKIF
jgi:hypothetical protein